MRLWGRLLGALALAAALSARAEVRAVLHEPRAGQILRGGTTATVSWSAERLPAFVEEWEAFLSIDGGGYYAYRITPHLESDVRRFAFTVPNVATDRARLLIRAGDERREIEIDLPVTFTIERDEAQALATPSFDVDEERRGEAAREGDRGVIAWIEGNRDGSDLHARDALERHCAVHRASTLAKRLESVEEADATPNAQRVETARVPSVRTITPLRSAPRHRPGREVLLAYRRLNI